MVVQTWPLHIFIRVIVSEEEHTASFVQFAILVHIFAGWKCGSHLQIFKSSSTLRNNQTCKAYLYIRFSFFQIKPPCCSVFIFFCKYTEQTFIFAYSCVVLVFFFFFFFSYSYQKHVCINMYIYILGPSRWNSLVSRLFFFYSSTTLFKVLLTSLLKAKKQLQISLRVPVCIISLAHHCSTPLAHPLGEKKEEEIRNQSVIGSYNVSPPGISVPRRFLLFINY